MVVSSVFSITCALLLLIVALSSTHVHAGKDKKGDASPSVPTSSPTDEPTVAPTDSPTVAPTDELIEAPLTNAPSPQPNLTFVPGLLNFHQNGLLLSQGLSARILARSGQPVAYDTGNASSSSIACHEYMDFGATFIDHRPWNVGGWIYVSNSEIKNDHVAGVGAFTFDKDAKLIDYRMVLENSIANCGGGRAPWDAWISCEEIEGGKIWQVDPTGERPAGIITLGSDGGSFESFAYDIRNMSDAKFFVTEDASDGALRRWRPSNADWTDPWNILYGNGTTDYLLLLPSDGVSNDDKTITGTFQWTTDIDEARQNAEEYFQNTEGIDCVENLLYFVSKDSKTLFILNLDDGTYTAQSTIHGAFDGEPDQVRHVLGSGNDDFLLFTEDDGISPGVHGRNRLGQFFTLLEHPDLEGDETSGLALSPDGRHLLFTMQWTGILYDITRADGLGFGALPLNIRYHAV